MNYILGLEKIGHLKKLPLMSTFKKGRVIFPDWTHKIKSEKSCSHCHQPLFLAYRKSDLRPVLACVCCARLYLSHSTELLLAQANELITNDSEYSNRASAIFLKPSLKANQRSLINPNGKTISEPSLGTTNRQNIQQKMSNEEISNSYILKLNIGKIRFFF